MRICIVFIVVIVLVFSSCQTEQRYGDKSIFRYNVADGITSLDPAFARSLDNVSAVNQLFNGLVQTDEKLAITPAIALRWEILDSGKVYRFYLSDNVFYHKHAAFGQDSTRKVIASDFIYSFNRLVDSKLISPGKWVMNEVERNDKGDLKIIAQNDSVLDIYLKRPFPPFLGILSMQYCSVVPVEVVEAEGDDFRANPIGTGPFQFKYWKENTKLVYLRNPNYFEVDQDGARLPYLDAISISFTKDMEVVFLQFLKKEIDFLSGLKGTYKDELLDRRGELRDKYQGQVIFEKSPYLNTEYLGFLQEKNSENQLNNVYLRRAINYGFDRKSMLKYLRSGIGIPANQGFIPRGLAAFDENLIGFSYQADSVQALLKKAGFPNGKELNPIVLSTTSQYLDICEYLQSQLSKFGILIKIEVNQAATNNEMIANSKVNFFRKSWVADYPDAENYLSLFKSENFSPNGPNYTHYSNPTYDDWYNAAMSTTDEAKRIELYRKMDSTIIADAPVIPLFYDEVVRFYQPSVSQIAMNPMNLLVLKYAKKSLNGK